MNRAGVEVPPVEQLLQSPPPGYHPPDQLAYLFNIEVKPKGANAGMSIGGVEEFPEDKNVMRQGKNNFAELIAIAAGISLDDKDYIEHPSSAIQERNIVDITPNMPTLDGNMAGMHQPNTIMSSSMMPSQSTNIHQNDPMMAFATQQAPSLPSLAGNAFLAHRFPSEAPSYLNDPLREPPPQPTPMEMYAALHQQQHATMTSESEAVDQHSAIPIASEGYPEETMFQLFERARKESNKQKRAAILLEVYNKCRFYIKFILILSSPLIFVFFLS